jgi:hypothetical protein
MNETPEIHISVGSSADYEELVAEITFGKYFGVIISQEAGEGQFEITAHSLTPDGIKDYSFGKNPAEGKVSLQSFLDAIAEAQARLTGLRKRI